MLSRLSDWLARNRLKLMLVWAALVAACVIALQGFYAGRDWLLQVQLALTWGFLAAVLVAVGQQVPRRERRRLWLVLIPGLVLLGAGVLVPRWLLFFGGGGLGWIVAAQFITRGRVRMEYREAVRHLRRREYDQALVIMQALIKAEPDVAEHYRFRADLYRLSGNLRRAARDYEQVIALDPQKATGYTGLAEVYVQQGDYEQAREYAQRAIACAPRSWMPMYNMGLIADRLGDSAAAVEALQKALAMRIPHSRFRLLAHLWLARNYSRLGRQREAQDALAAMQKEARGLDEWEVVFGSEQAAAIKRLLEADVQLARGLLDGMVTLEVLRD